MSDGTQITSKYALKQAAKRDGTWEPPKPNPEARERDPSLTHYFNPYKRPSVQPTPSTPLGWVEKAAASFTK